MIRIYTDGACAGNPGGPGGWGAVIYDEGGARRELSGRDPNTTNNRMEITAVIRGLEATPSGSTVLVLSDSEYVIKTMTRGWQRKANTDLWRRLDALVQDRQVSWEWVQGHNGNPDQERADALAVAASNGRPGPVVPTAMPATAQAPQAPSLSHLDSQGRARMVDVGWKPDTERIAVARGFVKMQPETLRLIQEGRIEKGDVLATARIAGVMAAKRTPDLIPMCHPLPITNVAVELEPDEAQGGIRIQATVKTVAKTGVEMEALTAVAVAALTIYDMAKSVDRAMRIEAVRLARKSGGKSGEIVLED